MITKLAFVSHPTRNIAASKRFFGEILGLKQGASYQDMWCELDTPEGKSIALDSFSPEGTKPYLALETNDIDAEIARLKGLEVKIVKDVWDNGPCKMAIIEDPAGNPLMLHQISPDRWKAMQKTKAAAKKPAKKTKAALKKAAKPAAKSKRTAPGTKKTKKVKAARKR